MSESDKPVFIIHRVMAVVLDVAIVALFIAIGKKEHHQHYDLGGYIQIGLPFLAAFFATMNVVAKDLRSVKAAFISGLISVPIAIGLRVAQPQYEFKPAFLIVSWIFLTLGWTLWRVILGKLRPAK